MWIVQIALRRPYTFIVLALLLLLLGPLMILRTPTDVFPNIDIPVISIVSQYSGLSPEEMSQRIVTGIERVSGLVVNDIEHIESQSLTSISVIKLFFQPSVKVELAMSQVAAMTQAQTRQMPPGTQPPFVLLYNASSVPVLQLALTSDTLSEAQLFDLGNQTVRTQLYNVQGASMPFPFGGKSRQIQVDLNLRALQALQLTPADVSAALGAQNVVIPAGTQKIGGLEYSVKLNGSTLAVDELNDMPIKEVNGTTIYVRDIAHVHDGYAPQQNIVRMDGKRAVLMSIQKVGNASTLDIVQRIKDLLPMVREQLPDDMKIETLSDQSLFVKSAVKGVIHEGVIAAVLTALMILLFLGSWRSTLIIAVSIPLSVLASIMALSALGETINLMTLGGLALAVGILVDDATVTVENINYHLEHGKPVEQAILDGAQQIAVPALVSTLAICIVFVPMFFLEGVARYLFVPMAQAVVFGMLASYVLSRTLIPTLAKYLLKPHLPHHDETRSTHALARFQRGFERRFENMRRTYHDLLGQALRARGRFLALFMGATLLSFLLVPWLGRDFFPIVDSGQIKLHVRATAGMRIEETARLCDLIQIEIRKIIPTQQIANIVDNIGVPISGINLVYNTSGTIGSSDADIYITLRPDHDDTADHIRNLREQLPLKFPGTSFSFPPADIVSQILNFGLPAPIDVQIMGSNLAGNRAFAEKLLARLRNVTGATDLRIQQTFDYPEIRVTTDRTRAGEVGVTQQDIATNLLISLSGTAQQSPSWWVNPQNGVQYPVITQAPQYTMTTLQDLLNLPVKASRVSGGPTYTLSDFVSLTRAQGPGVVSHYNVLPVIDIYGAVQDRDLGAVAADMQKIIDSMKSELPRGSRIAMRGQIETLQKSFSGLFNGLAFAIVLVYLLLVVNFQSWTDPLIIITALPAALAGIVWMLFTTATTLSVPALTGAIMCMGVATANSVLVVSFARERLAHGRSPLDAALDAGFARLRPVLMTALAMIIGMLPMALGLGEGGEQNAPLGRAVVGGLLLATVATLFFVPAVFSLVHGRRHDAHLLTGANPPEPIA
ncbi:MAG: efflux RND transporter permease subunit [Spongiibacteraceae bacterium]